MESILLFLEKYSNVLIAFFAFLTTIATFLIWRVSSKQTEVSRRQAEIMYVMGQASEQPIIKINKIPKNPYGYSVTGVLSVVLGGFGGFGGGEDILIIQVINVGKGSAYNLKIEQQGQETKKINILPAGQKIEYFVSIEELESKRTSETVKVEYKDTFHNKFTSEV